MTNPIDSLPATPETVGMPRVGDVSKCYPCDWYETVMPYMIENDGTVVCRWCGSCDVEKVKT